MNRRQALSLLATGSAAGLLSSTLGRNIANGQSFSDVTPAMSPIKITKVKIIHTYPNGTGFGIVKVETSEPGLYGIGCATGIRRYKTLTTAVEEYLDPLLRGKDPDNIEDIWQTVNVSTYWRNGPILNTVMAGLDQALWDIKGKRAGMPVYQLLGGKCRFAVDCYGHASGDDLKELKDSVQKFREEGFRHIRIQLGRYGSPHLAKGEPDFRKGGFGVPSDTVMEIRPYMKIVPEMFEFIRSEFGDEVELLHDVHELLPPIEAINLVKELEQYRPFFIEDPFAPEDIGYFKILREQTSCAIAMGELFNNSHEWVSLITERLIDFVRIHISQIGGITPAMKVARLAEWFNVRTAWHGPGNTSPVGHVGNAHIDLAIWNFGIQEQSYFGPETQEVFPGCPTYDNGYMIVNEAPGFGIDIDEKAAAKYPLPDEPWYRPIVRRPDGTAVRP
ncbi:MAG: starvation-sensing protein RspA [Verrucomicrobia bacterium]|nr:starvation-sensing protein RspA [Verrucomicrobiota bacterium]